MRMVPSPCLGVAVRELVGVDGRQAGQDGRPQPRQDAADVPGAASGGRAGVGLAGRGGEGLGASVPLP